MNIELIQKIRENGQKLADLRIAIAGAEVNYAYWRKVAFARDMQNVPPHARALAEIQWELKYDRQELVAKLEEQLYRRSPLADILGIPHDGAVSIADTQRDIFSGHERITRKHQGIAP